MKTKYLERSKYALILSLIILLIISGIPLLIESQGGPLIPPELEQTVTSFAPTAAIFETQEAEKSYQATSEIIILPTETPASTKVGYVPIGFANPTATPSVVLPRIMTMTPLPPVAQIIEITSAEAEQTIAEDIKEIRNPKVNFSPLDDVIIVGEVEVPTLLGTVVSQLKIEGKIQLRGVRLYIAVSKVMLGTNDISATEQGRRIEPLINDWVHKRYLLRRDVHQVEIHDESLRLDVVEHPEGHPAAPRRGPTITPSPTIPLLSATPQSSNTIEPEGMASRYIVITDADATLSAHRELAILQNPVVRFTSSGMELTGTLILGETSFIPNTNIPIRLFGTLTTRNNRLSFDLRTLEIGIDVDRIQPMQDIQRAIELWLTTAFTTKPVADIQVEPNRLTLSINSSR